ncbi:MAG: hypothetical protein WA614_09720 [Acidimicrobiales bacterium]|jgi:hypothetical protein
MADTVVFSPVPVKAEAKDGGGPWMLGKTNVKKGDLKGLRMGIRSEWTSNLAFMMEMKKILIADYGIEDDVTLWDLQSDEGTPFIEGGRSNEARINGFYDDLVRDRDFVVLGLCN